MHEHPIEDLGAYVLGQLDAEGAGRIEQHLAACESCRAEVAALRPLVGPLSQVDPDAVRPVGIAPPPELDRRILAVLPPEPLAPVRSIAGRRRWAPWVAGGLVGAAAASALVLALPGDDPVAPGPAVIAVDQLDSTRGVTAEAGLVDHTWGVEVKLEVEGLQAGETYAMRVVADDGTEHDAGQLLGTRDGTITCSMSSAVLLADAREFDLVDDSGNIVVHGDIESGRV